LFTVLAWIRNPDLLFFLSLKSDFKVNIKKDYLSPPLKVSPGLMDCIRRVTIPPGSTFALVEKQNDVRILVAQEERITTSTSSGVMI